MRKLILAVSVALLCTSCATHNYYGAQEQITSGVGSLTRIVNDGNHPTPDGGDDTTHVEHISWTGDGYLGVQAFGSGNAPSIRQPRHEPLYGRIGEPANNWYSGPVYDPPNRNLGGWRPSYYGSRR